MIWQVFFLFSFGFGFGLFFIFFLFSVSTQSVKTFTSKFTHFDHIAISSGEGTSRAIVKDKWSVILRVFQVNFSKDLALAHNLMHNIIGKNWRKCLLDVSELSKHRSNGYRC